MKFRKKPVVIDAVQFTQAVRDAHLFSTEPLPPGVSMGRVLYTTVDRQVYEAEFFIETLEGRMAVSLDDWILTGIKGEHYPCKPDIFAATYEAAEGDALPTARIVGGVAMAEQFDFGLAVHALRCGERVARAGWNGASQWVALGKGNDYLAASQFWNEHARAHAEQNGGGATVLPYFILKTAQGSILMGWSPSQSDALAEDWLIVE